MMTLDRHDTLQRMEWIGLCCGRGARLRLAFGRFPSFRDRPSRSSPARRTPLATDEADMTRCDHSSARSARPGRAVQRRTALGGVQDFRGAAGRFLVLLVLLLAPATAHAQQPATSDWEIGVQAYLVRGDAREAIRRIGDALDAGTVPIGERPRAHIHIANAFLSLGDTESALPHIEAVLAASPCALPSSQHARPEWIALYDQMRSRDVNCRPRAVTATLQSVVLPGWGLRSLGRSQASTYFFAATAASATGALLFNSRADSRYAEYVSSTDLEQIGQLYDDAEGSRRNALVFGSAAAVVYLWNVIDTFRSGMAYDRQLSAVRPLAVAPVIVPTGSGMLLGLSVLLK
jgi:hypothetical protein